MAALGRFSYAQGNINNLDALKKFQKRSKPFKPHVPQLKDVFEHMRGRKATDPRDWICAALGLLPFDDSGTVKVDYTLTEHGMFTSYYRPCEASVNSVRTYSFNEKRQDDSELSILTATGKPVDLIETATCDYDLRPGNSDCWEDAALTCSIGQLGEDEMAVRSIDSDPLAQLQLEQPSNCSIARETEMKQNKYRTGISIWNAYITTLIADRTSNEDKAEKILDALEIVRAAKRYTYTHFTWSPQLTKRLLESISRKALLTINSKYIGPGPEFTQPGDHIVILNAMEVPLVLRKIEKETNSPKLSLKVKRRHRLNQSWEEASISARQADENHTRLETKLQELHERIKSEFIEHHLIIKRTNTLLDKVIDLVNGKIAPQLKRTWIVKSLQSKVPAPDIRFSWFQEPSHLEDARGHRLPVPSEFNFGLVRAIIKELFRTGPGRCYVLAGDYQPSNIKHSSHFILSSEESSLNPGIQIRMAIVMNKSRTDHSRGYPMPHCGSASYYTAPGGGHIYYDCGVWFAETCKIEKAIEIQEIVDSDDDARLTKRARASNGSRKETDRWELTAVKNIRIFKAVTDTPFENEGATASSPPERK